MTMTPSPHPAEAQEREATQWRKKPVVVTASQWFKNGDHPQDYAETTHGLENGEMRAFSGEYRKTHDWEGGVVRYYRHPGVPGDSLCEQCGKTHHVHGWIDTLEQGHRVCPGDWIITGVAGEMYPCKPSIFEATYERASHAHAPATASGEAVEAALSAFNAFPCPMNGSIARDWNRPQMRAAIDAALQALAKANPAAGAEPGWSDKRQAELNDWFLSLPEGRRRALLDGDRWQLAGAAFLAGAKPTTNAQAEQMLQTAHFFLYGRVFAPPATSERDAEDAADMFWDDNDPERMAHSIYDIVEERDGHCGLEVGQEITVQRAQRMSNVTVRITKIRDEDGNGEVDYETLDAQREQSNKEGGK